MKAQCIAVVLLLAVAGANAEDPEEVTPIGKVISLLKDLKSTIEEEAKDEAKIYDKFSCFCKDKTVSKSDAITEGQTTIDDTAASIGADTAALAEKETELAELKKQIETLTREIAEAEAQRAKEKAEYEAVTADLSKAIKQMEKAIEALESSKPSLIEVRRTIRRAMALADVMEVNPKHLKAIHAFLQEESDSHEDPPEEYEFQSEGIIDVLKDMKKTFTENKEKKDKEEDKAAKAHTAFMEEKEKMKADAEAGVTETEDAIKTLMESIADSKSTLITEEAELKDNQLYIKDLTERCELKAKEWDQRTVQRDDEIKAISAALELIEGAGKVEAARAMLQQDDSASSGSVAKDISDHRALNIIEDDVGDLEGEDDDGNLGLAFLQEHGTAQAHSARATLVNFLSKNQGASETSADELDARKKRALATLAEKGRKLASPMLLSLALKLGPDPFAKVKKLIQALVERLLKEMAEEAGHKGFCDTELGKAKTTRDFEHEKTQKLSAELEKLEVAEATLKENIKTLVSEIEELNESLEKATKLRDEEKESNMETINKSKEGLEAITEAIKILKDFYKGAGKAKVLLQASPIDEAGENPGEVAGGAYKGKQTQGANIIAMLQVIKSDFERSIKQTEEAEDASHSSFISFDRESKSSLSTKETAKTQAESDLEATKIAIKESMASLSEAQSLIDDQLKAIEELKPVCIDTGMSYEERVAKREEEIEALKKALCQLDPEGVEAECS